MFLFYNKTPTTYYQYKIHNKNKNHCKKPQIMSLINHNN